MIPRMIAATVFLFSTPAWSCVTAKVTNNTDKTVDVVWGALGCAGVYSSFMTVCTHHEIAPGETKSHNWAWGKSAQEVVFHYPFRKHGKVYWVKSRYSYHHSGNKFAPLEKVPETPGSCGRTYHISYTQNDMESDKANKSHDPDNYDETDIDSES